MRTGLLPEGGRIEDRQRSPLPRLESESPQGLQDAPAEIGRLRKIDDTLFFLTRCHRRESSVSSPQSLPAR